MARASAAAICGGHCGPPISRCEAGIARVRSHRWSCVHEPMNSAEPKRDFRGYGRYPPAVAWPGGARLALSFAVNYEEGAEYSLLDGDDHSETHGVSYG